MYQTAEESYQDYLKYLRPGMRVKSFDEYWAGRVSAMELFEQMRPHIRNRQTTRRTSKA